MYSIFTGYCLLQLSCSIVDASGKDRAYEVAGKFRTRRWSEKKAAAAGPGYLVRKRQKLCGASDLCMIYAAFAGLIKSTRALDRMNNQETTSSWIMFMTVPRGGCRNWSAFCTWAVLDSIVLGIRSNLHSGDRSCLQTRKVTVSLYSWETVICG